MTVHEEKSYALSSRWLRATVLACGVLGTVTGRLTGGPDAMASQAEESNLHRGLQAPEVAEPTGVPFYFGVGQGTTGTHTMFEATCRLNLTSVHGDLACVDNTTSAEHQATARAGVNAHARSNRAYLQLRSCAIPGHTPKCTFAQTAEYISEMKAAALEMVRSGVDAAHDTPYTFMVQFMTQVIKSERGLDAVLLLSERDPKRWASRRAEAHPLTVVCRDSLGYIEENVPRGPFYDPFDLDQCLQRAINRQSELNLPPLTLFNDVFASYRALTLEGRGEPSRLETVHRRSEEGLMYYQDTLMEETYNVSYTVDMFSSPQPDDEVLLAQTMERTILEDATPEFVEAARSNGLRLRPKIIQSEHVNMTNAIQAAE